MRILLTGATGYIAQRLLPILLNNGNEVICCVRDRARFNSDKYRSPSLSVLEVDFLKPETLQSIPSDIDAAYYLIHSMSTITGDFEIMEETSAINFKNCIQQTKARQVIYLSGIVNEEVLSKHLTSRKNVERILGSGSYSLTTLRAGIIIGSGSASFEIIRDIVEKLPLMIAPRWLNTRSQPAEMKLPGEAWMEFKIDSNNILHQTATFSPLGLLGRLYWYCLLPFHGFIFMGMIRKIALK